jgi:hypothetical protein
MPLGRGQVRQHFGYALIACFTWPALVSTVEAGEIVAFTWSSGIASVAGEPIVPPVSPNNDDVVGPSPNTVVVTQKAYNGIGPVDLEFTVVPSGGVTEYLFLEGVFNGTGIDWGGYRLELGFGVGADFELSDPGDELDFDAPDYNSSSDFSAFFSTWTETEDVIVASGGLFPNGAFTIPMFQFSVDVPEGIEKFTIRQIPIPVPEPGMMTLVFLSSLAFIRRHRSRQEAAVGAD